MSCEHIFITGLSKSGTTGVYQAVKNGLRDTHPEAVTIFEPTSADTVDNVFQLAPMRPVLAKTTVNDIERLGIDPLAFDRRIMTVRDPRDIAVSTLLFRPLIARSIRNLRRADLDRFVAALRRKEADPQSVSVRELYELQAELGMGPRAKRSLCRVLDKQLALLRRGEFQTVRYEHFVGGETNGLTDYLGFDVTNAATAGSATFGHIARSQRAGGYSHWFREDDVSYFGTLLGPYLDALGYSRQVTLADPPSLDAAEGSEYVTSRFAARRAQFEQRSSRAQAGSVHPGPRARADYDRLTERADNGDPNACLQAARAAASGQVDGTGADDALHWARSAAILGMPAGMRLVCQLLDSIDNPHAGVRREQRAWTLEIRMRHNNDKRVTQLEAELTKMRTSLRYRVGSVLAELVRDPHRGVRTAARELRAAWDSRSQRR